MRKILKETKGAVTIFVSLLLIPAVLVSGTAVDLARIYTARSVLQDGSQLAANAALTQYNALLYDLYGLFGIAEEDPVLGRLLDDYISVSVFGEAPDRSLGTLQLLYGSDLELEEPRFHRGKHLGNEDVLRRQIEEYMKFRAPVIIVEEILKSLESNTLKTDTEIAGEKTAIDTGMAALFNKYKELYNAIAAADKCVIPAGGISSGHFGTVSSHLKLLHAEFVDLKTCYELWEGMVYSEDVDSGYPSEAEFNAVKADVAAKYAAILGNIKALTIGGERYGNWSDGRWTLTRPGLTGLNEHVEGAKLNGDNFKVKFDTVLQLGRDVDAMHDDLSAKVDELENKLTGGECSEELKAGLTARYGSPPMSVIERYRDILKWDDVTSMSSAYSDGGYEYIDEKFKPMLDDVRYRNSAAPESGSLTRAELGAITGNSTFNISGAIAASYSRAAFFAGIPEGNVGYSMPEGFLKYAEIEGENGAFFAALTAFVNQPEGDPVKLFEGQSDAEGSDAEGKQRNLIDTLLTLVDTAYTGLTNNPLGALRISDAETPDPERPGILDILTMIPQALSEPVVGVIKDPVGSLTSAGDYALLLTYCSSMFSNYSTTRPESLGKTREDMSGIDFTESITGVPISPRVNYFFQSEWEYIYHGSQNAGANLSAVTRLLFLVRIVCNYIAVFSVPEVTSIVTGIQVSFAWCPPLGVVLGELARAAFAVAESLIDIAALRTGHKVPLYKNVIAGEWICSPSGIVRAMGNIAADGVTDSDKFNNEKGLSYSNYMLFFFVAKAVFYFGAEEDAATEMAIRAGHLIEWNMINYLGGVNADEGKMTEALASGERFRLNRMVTDFSLTATANVRMLFLSLPMAQRGISGTVPPGFFQITATDSRGY